MYTCLTCQAEGSEEFGKHFTTTRHKNVKFNDIDETIKCEECDDTNIHGLKMIRYGLTAITLRCAECSKSSDPEAESATYSLSNGSLFTKLPQYYTYRDIECMRCGSDKNVMVADRGHDKYIYCRDCRGLTEDIPSGMSWIPENHQGFLQALLGITEHVPKSKGKAPVRKGKKSDKPRRPKKVDPNAEEKKAYYEAKMATKAQFQSGTTIKAKGSETANSNQGSRFSSRGSTKSPVSRKGTPNNSKAPEARGPIPDSKTKSHQAKGKSANGSKGPEVKNGKSVTDKPAFNVKKAESTKKNGTAGESKLVQPTPRPPVKLPAGIYEYQPSAEPRLQYSDMTTYYNEMCFNLFLEEKAALANNNSSVLQSEDFVLEWYAQQDVKHKQYKVQILLTQDILDRYMSKNLQAVKSTPFAQDQGMILVLDDRIPWYGRIAMVDTFNPEKPSLKKGRKGRGKPRGPKPSGPQVCEMAIELYSWNTMPLPTAVDVNYLTLLPVSVPTSRIFFAMSKLSNPKFKDLLLGQKEVKQLNFKNYLQLTKDTFNESQKVGLQSVLNNSITVLQGPPGTGKTSTIHEIILQMLEKMHTSPILVVAASNIAIDNIAEKLLEKHGKSILRITSLQKEIEYNKEHPLASICLHHKVYDGLPAHQQEALKALRRPNEKISKAQYSKLMSSIIDFSNRIIASSKVILTTTVTAGGLQLKALPRIPIVIMDEATQSSEPSTLIPLSMNGVEKFVFVGDHKQLSSFSDIPNLSLSLFERILRNGTYKTPHMLDTQYRMHPAISEFPRHKFYNDLLKDGITAEHRIKEGIPANPVTFWDTNGKKPEKIVWSRFKSEGGMTYANQGEILSIEKVLMTLIYDKGIKKSNIGVITPYRGQRDLISNTLVKNDLINPDKDVIHEDVDRDDFFDTSKPVTIHTVSDIMIASIDAFQGREKDFMIMSCVRSNKDNKVGFLKDERRLNVALTRARYGLIIIGDATCLRNDPLWNEYIEHLTSKGSLLSGDEFVYS
ncbi:hypothetical protein CA3LBN_000142 [Candidozyma haemuli]|uniref:AAA+ ATPase domain-containing protein n=1 Tax=Candidozyma haemuli TaxID=45357 RepID=A0ABX8HYY9_9ASCO|nr:hypothetical protein CA3LBN_000142 [[Candida] haemuloni]